MADEFNDIIGATHSEAEQAALGQQADVMVEQEFEAFSREVKDLLWAFQNIGYKTTTDDGFDTPEWAAIKQHPQAQQIAAFLGTTPAFRRPILDPNIEYDTCDNFDCQREFPAGTGVWLPSREAPKHLVCAQACATGRFA